MTRTYTEAQYSTASAKALIRDWLGGENDDRGISRVANYMSKSLRIGGIDACRALVIAATECAP